MYTIFSFENLGIYGHQGFNGKLVQLTSHLICSFSAPKFYSKAHLVNHSQIGIGLFFSPEIWVSPAKPFWSARSGYKKHFSQLQVLALKSRMAIANIGLILMRTSTVQPSLHFLFWAMEHLSGSRALIRVCRPGEMGTHH
jgi:hypothetical protein